MAGRCSPALPLAQDTQLSDSSQPAAKLGFPIHSIKTITVSVHRTSPASDTRLCLSGETLDSKGREESFFLLSIQRLPF